jgi:hypothetical protein
MRLFSQTQLGLAIRVDINKKATEQLGEFLKLIGLKLKKTRSQKIKGKKFYYYQVDSVEYSEIEFIAKIRRRFEDVNSSDSEWTLVNKLHGLDDVESILVPKPVKTLRRKGDNGSIFSDFI